ncbi:MAG: hypothetical protein ACC608_03890 [Anaerofustis sp.]
MAQTSKELIDAMMEAEAKLRAEGDAALSASADSTKTEAEANGTKEAQGAQSDYDAYRNPTDVRAAAAARLGLNGTLSETAANAGYNAYRSRLAAAAQAADASRQKTELQTKSLLAQSAANAKTAQAAANQLKNSDYWQNAQWDYKLKSEQDNSNTGTVYSSSAKSEDHRLLNKLKADVDKLVESKYPTGLPAEVINKYVEEASESGLTDSEKDEYIKYLNRSSFVDVGKTTPL